MIPLYGYGYFERISNRPSIIKLIGFTERRFYVKIPPIKEIQLQIRL